MGLELTVPAPYPSRTNTYAALDAVTAAQLNTIQDGIIAVDAAMKLMRTELTTQVARSQTATENQSDSPAPTTGGGTVVWVEKKTNGTITVTLDDSMDWRDRWIQVRGRFITSDAAIPGGASDDTGNDDQDYASPTYIASGLFYSHSGQTGSSSSTKALRMGSRGSGPLASDYVVIYAHSTTGHLMMKKDATANADLWLVARIEASPAQNHY